MIPENKNPMVLLRRWLSGEANRHDEQSLDALANNDPFLSEALEGYRNMPEGDHAAAVTKLKARLRTAGTDGRSTGFYLLRIAAAGALLVAAVFVFRLLQPAGALERSVAQAPKEQATGAATEMQAAPLSQETPQPAADAAPTAQTTTSPAARSLSSEWEESYAAQREEKFTWNEKAEPSMTAPPPVVVLQTADEQPGTLSDSAARKDQADDAYAVEDLEQDTELKKPAEESARQQPPTKQKKLEQDVPTAGKAAAATTAPPAAPAVQQRHIRGRVQSDSGEPLPYVSVQVKETGQGVQSDFDGAYNIAVPAGTISLIFSYTGYQTLEIKTGEETLLNVELSAGAELSEVVVSNLSKSKERRVVAPRPKGGFKKFEKYVADNLRLPEAAWLASVNGKVTLRFRVPEQGQPEGFEVVKSLGYGCDEEAMRLLRDGPEWKAQPAVFTTYTFSFR